MANKIAKICLIGEPRVGKTSLRKRYMGHGFQATHLMTIGTDFAVKNIMLDDGTVLSLQIWDLAGQHSFQKIRLRFYQNVRGAIFVYDVTNQESLTNLTYWFKEMWTVTKDPQIPVVLVGNKIDLADHVITESQVLEELKQVYSETGVQANIAFHARTSALTGENVTEVFDRLAKFIAEKIT